MIGSAAHIDFDSFFLHMGGIVFAAWLTILFALKFLFRKELAVIPDICILSDKQSLKDPQTWHAALWVLGFMVILFVFHHALAWEAWMVSATGLTLLLFVARHIDLDESFGSLEMTLLIFFVSLFILVGGVEHSHFLEYIGSFIQPFVESDLLLASIVLMWAAAVLSALIDNIPFTAAMVPILLGFESQGVDVTPLWWSLAIGVGMGGNGTHLGSTANIYIVTISERLAKESGDPGLAITPGLWIKKGTPVMILTLLVSSLLFWLFFDFFDTPILH
jgi:Na+/H+ antiporter NhaD/arsenite permease-like protein